MDATSAIRIADAGRRLDDEAAHALEGAATAALLPVAARLRDAGHGERVTFSPKVFIPLTKLCRDVCRYCTFAHPPRRGEPAYLAPAEAIAIATAGAAAGCHEALFTLGDRPELRYRAAREALAALGHASTIDYLVATARAVHEASGLLPHVNPGVMTRDELAALREVSVSAGMMLENVSPRLTERGGPHHGCPDKHPDARLETLRAAGELGVPFTTGILIGIGETRRERIESLLAIRALHERHGHVQEVIVQNFRAKPGTAMATHPEPSLDDYLWTIATARLVLGTAMSVQAPPNLSPGALDRLLAAGVNDWGGVSPVTLDHVNPECPWPNLEALRRATEAAGKVLVPRLAVYPHHLHDGERWLHPAMRTAALARADAAGLAREDGWTSGDPGTASHVARLVPTTAPALAAGGGVDAVIARALAGGDLDEASVARLLDARGPEVDAVCAAADELRENVNGDDVTYVVNRNINYTNLCYFRCRFCAFSKGRGHDDLRGAPYDLPLEEIARRTREAWARGATEVCLQGGIHPDYTGRTYLDVLHTVKDAAPGIHVHAFSPLEVWQGAKTLGVALPDFLAMLRDGGLGSLPGTAAEILDDEVRRVICPDKLLTAQWLEVMAAAHAAGLRTTATMMFGHVETYRHQARHLLRLRELQSRTGGFTEFVPLPFVAREAPLFRKGGARRGPTLREALLVHAVARLALAPHFTSVQASWVKMGPQGVAACLRAGANDMGGTLMNESITRAAGAGYGEELPPEEMETLIRELGRTPRQRTTLYAAVPESRRSASFAAPPLAPLETPLARRAPRADRPPVLVRAVSR